MCSDDDCAVMMTVWGHRFIESRRAIRPSGRHTLLSPSAVLVNNARQGLKRMECTAAPGEPGLAFVQARHPYTSPLPLGSTTRPAFLLTYLTYTTIKLSTLNRSQGEGGNPLARREAGETTPPRGCSCFSPIAVICCWRPTSVHRGPCSLSGCKPHP